MMTGKHRGFASQMNMVCYNRMQPLSTNFIGPHLCAQVSWKNNYKALAFINFQFKFLG